VVKRKVKLRQPEQTQRSRKADTGARGAILDAATQEFARMGFAGARTKAIAGAADVNIALLYYYFRTKEKLYGAVLERVFAEWARRVSLGFSAPGTPTQRLRIYLENYFDFVAELPARPRLVQQEMMQLGRLGSASFKHLATTHVRPVQRALMELLEEGHKMGEFRKVGPDFVYTMSAIIVTYFTSSTFIQAVSGQNPLTLRHIAEQRKAVLETIAAALFTRGGGTAGLEG
jgi:TetR/AcrR family transcriptional regulator